MASVRGLLNIQYLNESTHARNAPRSGFRRRSREPGAAGGTESESARHWRVTGALPLPAGAPAHLASRLFNE